MSTTPPTRPPPRATVPPPPPGSKYTYLRYELKPPILYLVINRPDKKNVLSPTVLGEFVNALERAATDETVRVVVFTGAGNAFSAGMDVGALTGLEPGTSSFPPATFEEVFAKMHELGKPTVAMVNGHALAGGLGLVAACDLAIAAESAKFGLNETNLGLWPNAIMAELTRVLRRKDILEMTLTGVAISAARAREIGLVNEIVAGDDLEKMTLGMVHDLISKSSATVALGLKSFYKSMEMERSAAGAYLEKENAKIVALEDAAEGIAAFMQKRKPVWKGK